MIYLDNAATTYPKPEVVYKALDKANRQFAFNAGRGHYKGANEAFSLIEDTRKLLCKYGNAEEVFFTPSATHALNQIVRGLEFNEGDVVFCSPYDHNAIVRTLHGVSSECGFQIKLLPLDDMCKIDLKQLRIDLIREKPKAVFCTHVSNVTGYILPIGEIGSLIKDCSNATFVVDGAQAFGLVPVDLKNMNIDYYVFAGHKTLYGPLGIAGYLCYSNKLKPVLFGGTGSDSLNLEMPKIGASRFEPSSPNVVAIYGLYEAIKWVFEHDLFNHERTLLQYAIKSLQRVDGIELYTNEECVGILSFNLNNYNSEDLAEILSQDYDICVRGGYHCCPFIHDFLRTKENLGTVRISFSYFSTIEDIDALYEALDEISLEG